MAIAGFQLEHAANVHSILTTSGGVAAVSCREIADAEGIVAAADAALYAAKQCGRNRVLINRRTMQPRIRIAVG